MIPAPSPSFPTARSRRHSHDGRPPGPYSRWRSWRLLAFIALVPCFPALRGADEPANLYVNPARLAAFNDWKFGLFIHWGPWSQTRIGYIWKITQEPAAAREKHFELWRTFDPEKFDPAKWARAAKNAGMKYVVFVVKHHDGFNNDDTALSDYKITAPGSGYAKHPQPDITRAVVDAFRAEGLAIGFYYSNIDWHHPDGRYFSQGSWDYDPGRIERDPASWHRFANYEKGQIRELLTKYGKIDLIWFDIHWPFAGVNRTRATNPVVRADILDLLKTMKSLQPDIIFNDRGTDIYGGFLTPEQRVPEVGLPGPWESNMTITNGAGYWYKGDHVSAKSPAELVQTLIDIASKGGNFLLNVGPRPDGELSPSEYSALAGIGDWMKHYSECIYGTTRSVFLDLPWGRSTSKGHVIFLEVFTWPKDGRLVVPGLRNRVQRAWRVGDPARTPLPVVTQGEDKIVEVGGKPDNPIASVIGLEIDGAPEVDNIIRPSADGAVLLEASRAETKGRGVRYEFGSATHHGDYIEGITTPGDMITWHFRIPRPGKYRVVAHYAVQVGHAGSAFTVAADGAQIRAVTRATAEWRGPLLTVHGKEPGAAGQDNGWVFADEEVGDLELSAGTAKLVVRGDSIARDYLFYLKRVTLVPVPSPTASASPVVPAAAPAR